MCDLEMGVIVPKLTKRIIDAATCREVKTADGVEFIDTVLRDDEIKGFLCKITPSGRKVYMLNYRTKDGRERRPVIGKHGEITCDQARDIAKKWMLEVAGGGDPSGERAQAKAETTLNEFAERYFTQYANMRKKPSSLVSDRRNMDKHILPHLGKLRVPNITRQDVYDMHHAMRETPGAANRCVALLSKMMNLAEKWGIRPDGSNPCRHVERYPERKMERFLTLEEISSLGVALQKAETERTSTAHTVAAIRLLMLTGCRHGEILSLKWSHVDLEQNCLRLPDSKTGAKVVYIPPAAVDVLSSIKRVRDNPYVIIGHNSGQPLINLSKPWKRIAKKAGLKDCRIHDLRHTYASVAAAGGMSLHMIGSLLGHSQPATTARYAHLIGDPMRQAAARIGDTISAAMIGKKAEVIPLMKTK